MDHSSHQGAMRLVSPATALRGVLAGVYLEEIARETYQIEVPNMLILILHFVLQRNPRY